MPIRLFGIQIAHGYSPEAQVFAELLAHQEPDAIAATVLYQQWAEDCESATLFQQKTSALVVPMDLGFRSMAESRRLSEKVWSRLQFLSALPRTVAVARETGPEVIYSCQQAWDCRAATFVARKLNKPQIIHLHYNVGSWLQTPVLKRLLTCDHVIAISDFIRQEALQHGVHSEKITTIRNSIQVQPLPDPALAAATRHDLGIAPNAPLLGIVARLDPGKGQADTLRAFAHITDRYPDACLLVVGGETPWHPGYADTLKSLAAELGIAERVLFLGRRSDVPLLLAAMNVFVHPSRHEPFGLATAEASAAGLPVLAYAEGGTVEVVEDGVTGLLAAPGDSDGLAARMALLLDDPDKACRLGAAGRERMAQQFQPEKSSRQLMNLLKSVVAA